MTAKGENLTPLIPPPPSLCKCGAKRSEHPRGGPSNVPGSKCRKYEAAK